MNFYPIIFDLHYFNLTHSPIQIDLSEFALNYTRMEIDGSQVIFMQLPLIKLWSFSFSHNCKLGLLGLIPL